MRSLQAAVVVGANVVPLTVVVRTVVVVVLVVVVVVVVVVVGQRPQVALQADLNVEMMPVLQAL